MSSKTMSRTEVPTVVKKVYFSTDKSLSYSKAQKKMRYCISVTEKQYENIRRSKNGHLKVNAVVLRFPQNYSEKRCLAYLKDNGYRPLDDVVDMTTFTSKVIHKRPIAALGLYYESTSGYFIPVIKKSRRFDKKLIGYPGDHVFGRFFKRDFVVQKNN